MISHAHLYKLVSSFIEQNPKLVEVNVMFSVIRRPVSKFLKLIYARVRVRLHNLKKKILPPILEIENIKISLGKCISPNIETTIYHGYYEKAEIELLKIHLSSNDKVLEIGAGIGFLSSYCAKKIGSDRVFCYEANPTLESHIRKTYRINNVNPTLEICLIGEQIGSQEFYIMSDFWTSSFVKHSPENIIKTIKVPTKSFNQEIEMIDPSLLIVDIEGGEYELFKSANFHNIQKIIVELHNSIIGREKVEFVKNKLRSAGFQVVERLPNCDDEILFLIHSSKR